VLFVEPMSNAHCLAPVGRPPAAVVTKVNAQITAVLQLPEVREQFNKLGISPVPMKPEEFGRFVRDQIVTVASSS
jgi:tripartite-type tricarboxylate transporter receptor subunit TctC